MYGCVENAKARMKEEAAFAYCKCVLEKLEAKFPSLDSAAAVLTDTTRAMQYTQGCEVKQ
jgi:hypothetical protein